MIRSEANPEEIPPPGKPREWINIVEYVGISVDSWGLTFNTAPLYFNLSWLGLGLILAGLISFKLFKRFKGAK